MLLQIWPSVKLRDDKILTKLGPVPPPEYSPMRKIEQPQKKYKIDTQNVDWMS